MSELRFTARQLRTYIKSGLTPEELGKRFDCTTADIKGHIMRIYHRNQNDLAEKLWRSLEDNYKLPGKNKSSVSPTDLAEAVQAVTGSDASSQDDLEVIEPIAEKDLSQLTEDELRERESSLSRAVMSLESEHKKWMAELRLRNKALRDIQVEVEDIERQLRSCGERYDRIVDEANQIGTAMNKISTIRRDKLATLEAIRQKLDELKTVNLFIYADGRIEAPDDPDVNLDTEGYLDLTRKLSERPECFDLRIRDVQTLARLLIISEGIEKTVMPVFDIPELETAYKALQSA